MTATTPVVLEVSLGGPERDHDTRVTFLGRRFRIVRRGTSGDVDAACDVVREWASRSCAVAVTGIREAQASGWYAGQAEAARRRIAAEAGATPVTEGHQLLEVLQEWAVRRVDTELPG
ncbi:MAG TPA: dehydrogenase, partial [Nocardioides sp.]|nr:dehydrogenase [Nocardioides sp.]